MTMVFSVRRALALIAMVALPAVTAHAAKVRLHFEPVENDRELRDVFEYVRAEDDGDIVVSATKTAQTVDRAPAIIQSITARQISDRGYRTIAEALRDVPGVAILDDLVYTNVGIRGLYAGSGSSNDIVKVMINGQPVSFRPTSENFLGRELIAIEAVKRIEIIRGPASALYGANAFFGIVNIITWRGDDMASTTPARGKVIADSYYTPRNQRLNGGPTLLFGTASERFDVFVAGTFNYANRSGLEIPGYADMQVQAINAKDPFNSPQPKRYPSPGQFGQRSAWLTTRYSRNDLEHVGSVYASGRYKLSVSDQWITESNVQLMDRYGEWQDFSQLTHGNRLSYVNWFARTQYSHQSPDDPWSYTASLTFTRGHPTGTEHIEDPFVTGVHKRRRMGSNAADLVLSLGYAVSPDLSFTLGADYTFDAEQLTRVETTNNSTGVSTLGPGFKDRVFHNLGVLAQMIYDPWAWLSLTAGSRADYNNVIPCSGNQPFCLGRRTDPRLADFNASSATSDQSGGTGAIASGTPDPVPAGVVQISNRLGVVAKLPLLGMYAKALYGSSYKPPSPFHLFHYSLTAGVNGTQGSPLLRPETANTVEVLLGLHPVEGMHVATSVFYTHVTDALLLFLEAHSKDPRNVSYDLSGAEINGSYVPNDRLNLWGNLSYLWQTETTPLRRATESLDFFRTLPASAHFPAPRYPQLLAHGGLDLFFPDAYVRGGVSIHYIGSRTASLVNAQLNNTNNVGHPYELPGYFLGDLNLSSTGIKWFGDAETTVALSVRGWPGQFSEPGEGGIDVPSIGSRWYLRVAQEL